MAKKTKKTKKVAAPSKIGKIEFSKALAEKRDISQAAAQSIVGDFIDLLSEKIQEGTNISFMGFGTFSVKKRAERMGRNPQTGKAIKIKACNVLKFKPGKNIADSIK